MVTVLVGVFLFLAGLIIGGLVMGSWMISRPDKFDLQRRPE
jgi:hypothetical protein